MKHTQTFAQRMTSKKYFAFIFVVILATVSLWTDKMGEATYSSIIMMLAPLYWASDVGSEWFTERGFTKRGKKINEDKPKALDKKNQLTPNLSTKPNS
jgi:hypothetical protein